MFLIKFILYLCFVVWAVPVAAVIVRDLAERRHVSMKAKLQVAKRSFVGIWDWPWRLVVWLASMGR